jgi:succinate dehydrogenase / fumarate reductase, cytochrome b subunit
MSTAVNTIPSAFVWRRLQSLMGFWFVLFLVEHLLTNSQAALWLGDNGKGFVAMVDFLHNLPYLQVIEIVLIGVPILIHGAWGVKYLLTSKFNSLPSNGSAPSLTKYGRNHAYTWQRITSWILLIGIVLHVAKFRFLEYPQSVGEGGMTTYFVRVSVDNGLYTVADRLGVTLYDSHAIEKEKERMQQRMPEMALVEAAGMMKMNSDNNEEVYDSQKAVILTAAQKFQEKLKWVQALESKPLRPDEVLAVSKDFGTATLMAVRDTFKDPLYVGLYTIFVLAACFHAFNGCWTFLITWGIVLKYAAQKATVHICTAIMLILMFLGLMAVWGTYWLNLKQ